jgi:ABC-type multidrug transport system permease subunit
MNLLRELADQGRTVILVTHATANLEVCDRLAFMGRGGKLCFFGTPQAALEFFEMPAIDLKYFADIYIKLDQGKTKEEVRATVQKWANKFRASSASTTSDSPKKRFVQRSSQPPLRNQSPLRQLWLLSQRYGQLVLRDRLSLLLALFTGPIGIGLIALAVQNYELLQPKVSAMNASIALRTLFVFSCIAIWVGISCAAQEIVKEAAVYARERLVNLGLLPYLGSKLLVRSTVAIAQTLLLVISICLCFQSPEPKLMPWILSLGITNFLTLFSSICLGLLLSTFVKSENEANNALPLMMIPQLIFSGVLFNLEGISEKLSWLMLSRWSVGAYGALVDVNQMIPAPIQVPGRAPIPQPIEPNSIYDPTWANLSGAWAILGLSAVIYLAIALYLQKRKDVV